MEPEQLGSVPTDESAITQMCEVTGGSSLHKFLSCKSESASAVLEFQSMHLNKFQSMPLNESDLDSYSVI